MKDWKNIVSSIIGLFIAIAGALLGVASQITLPAWVITACIITMAVGAAVVAWLQGRNADLSRKSKEQLKKQAEFKVTGKD